MQKLIEQVENNSGQLEQLVQEVVKKYADTMDGYIEHIKKVLDTGVDDLSIEDLNRILIKITTYSYFLGTRQEYLGIRHDIADMVHMEKYNMTYIDTTSGTVANKTAKAEEAAKEEKTIAIVYDRAYKILKLKIQRGRS